MGRLTDEMARLCGEIVTLRGRRESFVKELYQDVASMRTRFRRDHAEMARVSRQKRLADSSLLRQSVASLLSGFRWSHETISRELHQECLAFVCNLKKTTTDMLHGYALDRNGAHRAWFGPSVVEIQARRAAEVRANEVQHQVEEGDKGQPQAALFEASVAPPIGEEAPETPPASSQSASTEPESAGAASHQESTEPETAEADPQAEFTPEPPGHGHRPSKRKKR